jgi:ATP-dependent Clp protease ATP-binding subunit ClpA
MKPSFSTFCNQSIKSFFEAIGNIFIFLPYFFSVTTIIKTLFSPWKNITEKKTQKGFSFSEFFERLGYNWVSRGMGFAMRISVLIFYLILQLVYFLSLIVIVPLYFIALPLFFLISRTETSDEEKKAQMKQRFVQSHTLKPEDAQYVSDWFETLYTTQIKKAEWWKLENLFSQPPIARDWSKGYTPYLDDYAEDFSDTSYQMHIKTIVGRKNELATIENVLSKTEDANILLVGEEGVGKRAVINAFAKRLYEGKTANLLAYKRVLKLNMEKILTNYTDQKQREVFFEDLLQEAVSAENVIILIENVDKYVSNEMGHVDVSIPLEKFGESSSVQFIGTTSPYFYQKYIVPNEKISRLFTRLDINEVSKQEAVEILRNTVFFMEHHYNVVIPYETILNTIDKSDFFITNLPFPEKAVQLLDSACVYATQTLKKNLITPEIINVVLSEKTHVPVSLSTQMKDKLLHIESLLLQYIVNQDVAVKEVASAMRRAFLLLGKRKKPLASFLFLGPTGVGKTETAKAISKVFFESEKNLLRFDMSLYQSKDDIGKLIGSSVTQDPGLLTEAIRNYPYGVLLLDELEKANHDLLNIFLTILDEGYFTNGFGKKVDCKNLIIIATSNAGAEMMFKSTQTTAEANLHPTQSALVQYLVEQHLYTPEFLNRFDGIVVFNQLDQNAALTVAKGMLKQVEDQIFSLYKVKVQISDATLQSIIENNYDPKFGARDMERALRQQIEDKVAKIILEDAAKEGDTISL